MALLYTTSVAINIMIIGTLMMLMMNNNINNDYWGVIAQQMPQQLGQGI